MAVQDREPTDQLKSKYYLAKCISKSSVVLQVVYGHIRSSSTLDLVFGKETSLELVVLSEDGVVQSLCEQPVFGTIKDLRVLPWNEQCRSPHPQTHGKDLLVLISDSGKLSFLTFCIELHRFLAVAHTHISQPGNSRRELGQLLAVEPRGRAVAVGAYEDKVAIFPASISAGSSIIEKRVLYPREPVIPVAGVEHALRKKEEHSTSWGTVWSMAFVPSSQDGKAQDASNTVLAVLLNRKGATQNKVLILVCDPKERTIQLKARINPSGSITSGPLAYHIVDVPSLPGYILILRLGDIMVLDIRNVSHPRILTVVPLSKLGGKAREARALEGDNDDGSCNEAVSALLELVSRGEKSSGSGTDAGKTSLSTSDELETQSSLVPRVCAWSWEAELSQEPSLLFGVDTGEMYLLQLCKKENGGTNVFLSDCLYRCSSLKSLMWIKNGFVAALVEMGEGQVLQIKDNSLCYRSPIQNIAPILDFALVDYHNEKQDQMFACSGVGREGSLRVIRNGVSMEKLISTPAVYKGVTGTWTMNICRGDGYHAFLVISFVEESRVLSVGLSFNDITESVGFKPSACTLACGWIEDGWVAQVCSNEVRVCAPTDAAHPKGINHLFPLVISWAPTDSTVSLGAVAHRTIVLAMSRPGLLVMLGLKSTASGVQELVKLQQCMFDAELSCISIPQEEEPASISVPPAIVGLVEASAETNLPRGVEIGKVCVVGTHKPSVELLSIVDGENFLVLAVGQISLINTMGTALSGCIPENVRLAVFDRPYILSGLRNGMLLRFEWPAIVNMPLCFYPTAISGKGSPFYDYSPTMEACQMSIPPASGGENLHWEMATYMQNRSRAGEKHPEEHGNMVPVQLHLIAVRRVGVSPVSLIPLQTSLRADVIALGDRPWLLQTALHSQRIAYTSISFQPSTHATPVKSSECTKGILFVADCSLHLVEMEHSKRLNVQRLPLSSTPRKVIYHVDSKTLLVMRTESCDLVDGCISEICCIDPLSGAVLSSYKFEYGETPKCTQLWEFGHAHLLLVGTGLTTGKAMISTGEPEGAKGRLLIFRLQPKHTSGISLAFSSRSSSVGPSGSPFSESSSSNSDVNDVDTVMDDQCKDSMRFVEGEGWDLTLKSHVQLPGVVLSVAPYLDQYILACAGNTLSCLGFSSDLPHRLKRYDTVRTRFAITCISVHLNRIAIGDCRDGILVYSYQEDVQKLKQLYCDPARRLVADCVFMDIETAMVTDRLGNFCTLSSSDLSEESASPERNLAVGCWYHMGEVILSMRKGSLAYKIVTDDSLKPFKKEDIQALDVGDSSLVASTLLGSIVVFLQITKREYELLDAVQTRLALFPLTAPVLGNNHALFRGQGCPAGVCRVLDGDMLSQFLELTSSQQQSVLADQPGLESLSTFNLSLCTPSHGSIPVEQVLKLLERIHNSLT